MVSIRDAWDALRGRIEHGDECECHRCKAETLRFDAAYKRESEAQDRKAAQRKAARKAVKRLAMRHGSDIARALQGATVWDPVTGQSVSVGDSLDCLAVRLPYGVGQRLVVSVTRDGSND